MRILLSPQIRSSQKIWYQVEHQKIKATINGVSDTFDFTGMSDGKLELWDKEDKNLIETNLSEVPILSAKKENKILHVEILFTIDIDEEDERLLFPKPMNLEDFNSLMDELSNRNRASKDTK